MRLHDYQEKVVREVRRRLDSGTNRRVLLAAATGSGKTVMSARLAADYLERGWKILFIVHREFLLEQTSERFRDWNLSAGTIAGGIAEDREFKLQIASIQTLARRNIDWFPADLLMFDECHITNFYGFGRRILPELRVGRSGAPRAIGLTGTPFRLNPRESLGDFYESMVLAPLPRQLIEMGYLTQPVYYGAGKTIDTGGLHPDREGEYNVAKLEVRCNVPGAIEAAVRQWMKRARGRKTIAFTVGVTHARAMAGAFREAGIAAAAVDGSMPRDRRRGLYRALGEGEILLLASCEALAEGFDVPSVSCVLLSRPTDSVAKYFQQIGRGLRTAPGKSDCIVLDQCGFYLKPGFGFIESLTESDFGLEPPERRARDSGAISLKACPSCDRRMYGFVPRCPGCGYRFPAAPRSEPTGEPIHAVAPETGERYRFYRERLKAAYEARQDPIHAVYQTRGRYGRDMTVPVDWGRGAVFEGRGTPRDRKNFERYLREVSGRMGEDWILSRVNLEFDP